MALETPGRPVRGWRRALRAALFVVVLCLVLSVNVTMWRGDAARPLRPSLVVSDAPSPGERPPQGPPASGAAPADLPSTDLPSTSPPPEEPPLRTPAPGQPLAVWFSGDSTAYAIGQSLVGLDDAGQLDVDLQLMTSSGLARPDFFDWPAFLESVQAANPREVMILSIGANDLQPLEDLSGTVHTDLFSPGWGDEYARRVDLITHRVVDDGTRLYWIGQPIGRDAEYDAGVRRINGILRDVAQRYDGAEFIDVYPLLAGDDLVYVDALPGPDGQPVTVRRPDGVHLTLDGGTVLADHVLEVLRRDWGGARP